MLKKTLITAAAALAITTGATTLSTPEAKAGVNLSINLGGGFYGGHHGYYCHWERRRVLIKYWKHGHLHSKWVWRSFRYC